MEQYIPKSALVAEIEKIKATLGNSFCLNATAKASWVARKEICEDILSFLDTLEVKDFWKSADGDDLPEIDREVIVLLKGGKVAFGHRPYKGKYSGKNLTTGNIETFENQTYDKGGWNIPNVVFWLDLDIPKL